MRRYILAEVQILRDANRPAEALLVIDDALREMPDDTGLLYVGRVWWDPFGEYKLLESANEAEEKGVLHVGVGLHTGEAIRGSESIGVVEDVNDQTAWNLELAGRWKRWP